MIFREAKPEEKKLLFNAGYKEWSKNRTFDQYCIDNSKEDEYGKRYVLVNNDEIVSSLIVLRLKDIVEKRVYGIGSVVTPTQYTGNGYATELLKNCINEIPKEQCLVFLYSDVKPSFYERLDFRILPRKFQKYDKSICMVRCEDYMLEELLTSSKVKIPEYF